MDQCVGNEAILEVREMILYIRTPLSQSSKMQSTNTATLNFGRHIFNCFNHFINYFIIF